MIALARPPAREADQSRPFLPGETVRLAWRGHVLDGTLGRVWVVDAEGVGVVWEWGPGGVSSFYASFPARRLERDGGTR